MLAEQSMVHSSTFVFSIVAPFDFMNIISRVSAANAVMSWKLRIEFETHGCRGCLAYMWLNGNDMGCRVGGCGFNPHIAWDLFSSFFFLSPSLYSTWYVIFFLLLSSTTSMLNHKFFRTSYMHFAVNSCDHILFLWDYSKVLWDLEKGQKPWVSRVNCESWQACTKYVQ